MLVLSSSTDSYRYLTWSRS